ncbi:aspartate-semialdehyde dehydrogenase [Pseudomonas sp. NPDC007930]|uniref:aspartate-semialdehyde dehydrogenase n=1 Tax=Pseudomonas sp. NPDC007930 TaxID=3364417 RepID=UPI0036E68DF4
MLSPITPAVHVPINPQLDPAKPTPQITPVVAPQATTGEAQIDLRQREQEGAELLRDRQRRGKRRPHEPLVVPGDELNADNTVPAVALIDGEERQGHWIDLKV